MISGGIVRGGRTLSPKAVTASGVARDHQSRRTRTVAGVASDGRVNLCAGIFPEERGETDILQQGAASGGVGPG